MFPLRVINIEITSFCPLSCPICFFKDMKHHFMEKSIFESIISEAKDLGVELILLSGGEPMEHNEIIDFIQLVKKNDMQVIISSSGIKINEETAVLFKDSGLDCCYISLCGSNARVHNNYREGFELSISAMKHLHSAKQYFRINWVACHDNIDDFPNVIKLAKELRASGIDILREKPYKAGLITKPVDEEKLMKLSNMIGLYINNGFIRVESCFDILKFKSKAFQKSKMSIGCAAGKSIMSVKADGSFMPCTHLYEYRENAENLKDYWINSKGLEKLRDRFKSYTDNCKKCGRQRICSPCRAITYCPIFTPKGNAPQFLSIYGFTNRIIKNRNV